MKKALSILMSLFFVFLAASCSKKIDDGFVFVEGGVFTMGNNSVQLPSDYYKHQEHQVEISSFFISPLEVTQKDFLEIMGFNPSYFQGDSDDVIVSENEIQEMRPVEKVTWRDAVVFCNKLSILKEIKPYYYIEKDNKKITDPALWESDDEIKCEIKSKGYRLLTEAEWEYAANGGNKSSGFTGAGYNSSEEAVQYGWIAENSKKRTHQVGILKSNELGIYDMSGNVWEWCWDWFDDDFYESSEAVLKNAAGPSYGELKSGRGSDWDETAEYSYNCVRGASSPDSATRFGGFRIGRNSNKK